MTTRILRLAAAGCVAALLSVGLARLPGPARSAHAAGGGPAVDWWVIAAGGGPASAGGVTLEDTLGQPIAGPSIGASGAALNAGYWSACVAGPAGEPALTARIDGADIVLAWTANPPGAGYQVWIATDPYFDPDRPGDVQPELTSDTTHTDNGAAASLVNHFYVVRSFNPCGAPSVSSARQGEFTYGLTPGRA